MPVSLGTALVISAGAAAGATAYQAYTQKKEAEKQRKATKEMQAREQEFLEKQAGEYYDITEREMELQAQQQNLRLLADVITEQAQPVEPMVYKLPPAKSRSPVDEINRAIDRLLKAG